MAAESETAAGRSVDTDLHSFHLAARQEDLLSDVQQAIRVQELQQLRPPPPHAGALLGLDRPPPAGPQTRPLPPLG